MIKKGKKDFKEGFKLEVTDGKNRMRVGGEEQKVENRVMGRGKKLNRISGPFSWMSGHDSKIMNKKRTESRV